LVNKGLAILKDIYDEQNSNHLLKQYFSIQQQLYAGNILLKRKRLKVLSREFLAASSTKPCFPNDVQNKHYFKSILVFILNKIEFLIKGKKNIFIFNGLLSKYSIII
jgi:hypothetical protein